jgi:hypothetical protein
VDAGTPVRYGRPVRPLLRWLNVGIALVTLASALAVLASDLWAPGYREHYGDALWFVTLYVVIQIVMVRGFMRDGPHVPWLVLAKTGAAYLFLLFFFDLWPRWRWWTPARYVYQLFAWGDDSAIGLYALVFLGRGAFNTVNAFVATEGWWRPLRVRRPLLGRLVTSAFVAMTVGCVWVFLQLLREERRTFSPEARAVALRVLADLDCAAVRARRGEVTTDLRAAGERRYHVRIAYDCALTRVIVRTEEGLLGSAAEPRLHCCRDGG